MKWETSFFSNETIYSDNYTEYINSKEPYTQKNFNSSLTKSYMNDSDNEIILKDYKQSILDLINYFMIMN
jgi:hypothetical protein